MLKLSTSCGALPDRQGQSTTTQQRLLRDAPFRCSSILSPPAETGSTGYCKSDSYMYNAHLTNRTMPIPKHKNIPTSKTDRTNPHKDAFLFSGMSLSEKADTISCRTPRTGCEQDAPCNRHGKASADSPRHGGLCGRVAESSEGYGSSWSRKPPVLLLWIFLEPETQKAGVWPRKACEQTTWRSELSSHRGKSGVS